MRRPIIVAVPRSDQYRDDAVALGGQLARVRKAPLILAGVHLDAGGRGSTGYAAAVRAATEQDLADAASTLPAEVERSTRVVASSSVVRGLHELAEETGAAILVVGPSHVGRVVRAVRGDIALGALHAAPCPVAVAPPGYAAARPASLTTVGVAYAATPEARDALMSAIDLAEAEGADLRILHVLGDPYAAMPYLGSAEGAGSDLEALRIQAEELLTEAVAIVADRVPVETAVLHGDPAGELIRAAADLELDLFLLGSRGFGPLRRVLLGSVAAGVVRAAPCPVLVLSRGAQIHAEARTAVR